MTSRRYWVGLSLWFAGIGLTLAPLEMRAATVGAGVLVQLSAAGLIVSELVRARRGGGHGARALPYALLAVALAGLVAGVVLLFGLHSAP